MKVLFIGGTGTISSACSALAIERGIELYLLVRGQSARPVPPGAHVLNGDIRDATSVQAALGGHEFDAVVDWVAFTPQHVQGDLDLFRGRTGQYVFISSASAYRKPAILPVVESAPLSNPYWRYSQEKIACEDLLMRAWRDEGFPVTIVRPAHTYDRMSMPLPGRYTPVHRMRAGKPVIVHGDGSSLWTLTHHRDFATGFIGLLGHSAALGEAFHITSDEFLSWQQILDIVAHAARLRPHYVYIASDYVNAIDPEWGASLLGDKAQSMFYDNSKIRRLVPEFRATIPFSRGVEEIMAWRSADQARQVPDAALDASMDRIVAAYLAGWPAK